MKTFIISPKFNAKNLLELHLKNNSKRSYKYFKLCFSLIYSIKSLKGANIIKQIGRYYELILNQDSLPSGQSYLITIKLQDSRINSFNMSCGPEGLFIIDKDDRIINSYISKLTFEKEIVRPIYENNLLKTSMPIIPEPYKVKLKKEFISCKNNFFVNDLELVEIANYLGKIYRNLNIDFFSKNGLKIIYKKENLKNEEYSINISKKYVIISALGFSGIFYALISIIHLISFHNNKLPLGSIYDNPKFKWRGMHLDCVRQFHTVRQIKKLLNYMALFKLNRFHWHLTDNESWRLDLKSYPQLVRQSAFRGYREMIPPVYGSGFKRYGGYYSLRDVKEIVKYAKKLNIEVMPEIELPAHSWATIQVLPNLHDRMQNSRFQDIGNYENNTINPALESTWSFLETVLKEVSEIFPFSLIHIGVDERPKNAWDGSPKMIKFMKKNKINNFDEIQDYFVNRIINFLKNNNKRTAAWNEAALPVHNDIGSSGSAGKIDKNCLIFGWEHPSVSLESLKKGFETVICPGQICYFDMAYNNSTKERGLCWAATIETKQVHEWQPLKNIPNKYHDLVKGIQGQLWSETLTHKNYFDLMVNPRLATLAEVSWSSDKRRNWKKFKSALSQAMKITKKLGWSSHNF